MSSKTDAELLLGYGTELGLQDPTILTVSTLVSSHRALRNDVDFVHEREVWKSEMKAAADRVHNIALDSTWVKWSELKRMDLVSIMERISFDQGLG